VSTVSTPRTVDVWQLLQDPHTPRTSWSISEAMAVELTRYLEWRRPKRILEIGSGLSTVVLGAYAVRHGAAVVTLEHAWKFHQLTKKGLAHFGMDEGVELRMAPLRSRRFPGYGRRAPWYDTRLEGQFDFVFVDGPPKAEGRNAVLFAIAEHLAPGWELWLDDARRQHERHCLRHWRLGFPNGFFRVVQRRDIDGKGVVVLGDASRGDVPAQLPRRPQLGGSLGIALIVNGDPTWPRRVERCLGRDLLESSLVVATARAPGPVAAPAGFVNHWVTRDTEALHLLASRTELQYVLRLDDHWSYRTLDETWLSRALEILDRRSDVELVCLQHRIDTRQHRAPDEAERGFVELGHTPFPDEPGLFRVAAIRKLVPADPDRGRRLSLRKPPAPVPPSGVAVQLFPGVFRRTGRERATPATPPPGTGR
jgi:predicted O-methyltransferase YrrM